VLLSGCGLELGGKDPAYVRGDANLANAIENLVDGAMFNSGQCCCGIERIYVHEKVYDAFVKGYVELVEVKTQTEEEWFILIQEIRFGGSVGPNHDTRTHGQSFSCRNGS
jgi:acyl-CoA reductase-like NAD-dependent aldehyde dehydrogenase